MLSRSVADAERRKDVRALRPGLYLRSQRRRRSARLPAGPDLLAELWHFAAGGAQARCLCSMRILGVGGAVLYAQIPGDMAPVAEQSAIGTGAIAAGLSARWPPCSASTRLPADLPCNRWWHYGCSIKVQTLARGGGIVLLLGGVLAAFSFPVAAWLSKRIGLINTMVFTHVPSSVCLILAAIAPSLEIASRSSSSDPPSQMDVTDTLVLRDGCGHSCGAAGGCQLYVRAAQSRRGGKPGHGRRTLRGRLRGLAAGDLRRSEDHLRCAASQAVPSSETTGGMLRGRAGALTSRRRVPPRW